MHLSDPMKKESLRIAVLLVVILLSGGFIMGKINNWGQSAQVVTSNAQVQIPLTVSNNPAVVPNSLLGLHLGSYYSKLRYNMDNPAQYNVSTGYTPDTVERATFANLNAKVYRFPNGTDSRYYHLFTSNTNTAPAKGYGYRIADVNSDIALLGLHHVASTYGTPSQYIAYEQTLPAGRNFIYDFIEDAKADNAKALFVASIIHGTPAEAVAAVTLLKENGVQIAGVELGNETNGDDIGFGGDPVLYLAKARTFATALKTAHPEIKLGLVAAPIRPTNSTAYVENDAWNTVIANALSTEPNLYDTYIFHAYPQVKCDNKPTRELAFDCANQYTGLMKQYGSLAEVKQVTGVNIGFPTISESFNYYKQKFPGKKMWLTEWNLSHWAGPQYQGSGYYANSIFNALFVGVFRNEMNKFAVENPGIIEYATQHNVTGFSAYGMVNQIASGESASIAIPGSIYVKRPLYHEYMISKRIYGKNLKKVSVSAPTNEPVDVHTYLDQPSNTLFVYYVNRSGKTLSFPTLTYDGTVVNMSSNQSKYYQMSGNVLTATIGNGGAGEVSYTSSESVNVTSGDIISPALHVIPAYAYGYLSIPLSPVVTPPNTAPVVSITTPSSDPTFSTSMPVISYQGNATDSDTGDTVTISWENIDGQGVTTSGTSTVENGVWQQGPFTVNPGVNTFKVVATDTQGLTAEDIITVTHVNVIENKKPTVKIISPTGNNLSLVQGAPVVITAEATDNVGVKHVEFYTGSTKICTDTTAPYTCTTVVPTGLGTNLSNSFRAFSRDYANKTSSPSITSFTVTQ